MQLPELFYQESGRVNPLRLIASYTICIIATLILGYLYSIITASMPIIYLNILLALGFAFLLVPIVKLSVWIGHIRNRKARIVQAAITGFLACYFQWVAYMMFAIQGKIPDPGLYISHFYLLLNPVTFFSIIAEMAKVGMWSMLGSEVKGFALVIVWIIEAAVIISVPILALNKSNPTPYSELLGKWYDKFVLHKDFANPPSGEKIITGLQNDPLGYLQSLEKGLAHRHTKIHLFYLKDEEQGYLSFESVEYRGRQSNKKSTRVLVNNFTISTSDTEAIMKNFKHKPERLDVL